jgi:hypothetical protein
MVRHSLNFVGCKQGMEVAADWPILAAQLDGPDAAL